ncbi:hypothetical protein ACHWQZ_G012068 [Mnemiopsis leidyi]
MLRTVLLALAVLALCEGRNLIREKREAILRNKRYHDYSDYPSEMPSNSPVSDGYEPSNANWFWGSYVSDSPVSGYVSDWFYSTPTEEPAGGKDPIKKNTFHEVAKQIASIFSVGFFSFGKKPSPQMTMEKPNARPNEEILRQPMMNEKPEQRPENDKPLHLKLRERELHF